MSRLISVLQHRVGLLGPLPVYIFLGPYRYVSRGWPLPDGRWKVNRLAGCEAARYPDEAEHSGKTVLSMTNLQRKYVLTYYTPPDGRHLRLDWWRAGLD